MKNIISRSIILLFLSVSIQASAATFTVNGLNYDGGFKNATVTGGNVSGPVLTIPGRVSYNGTTYDVTEIGEEAFKGNSTIETLIISSKSMRFETSAFENCSMLRSIQLKEGVTSINIWRSAFNGCTISTVSIPESLEFMQGTFGSGVAYTGAVTRMITPEYMSVDEVRSKIYNPSQHRNLAGKPVIIMTHLPKSCRPGEAAIASLQVYLAKKFSNVRYIVVDVKNISEDVYRPWYDAMDNVAGVPDKDKRRYRSPTFYFVNSDGSVKRKEGFNQAHIKATNPQATEFWNTILNLY